MKKIQSLGLLLLMVMFTSLSASALKVTFQWDIPGSVIIRTGSLSGDVVELQPGATSYVAETEGTAAIPYTYFFPAEGYVLTTMELPNGSTASPTSNPTYGQYWGRNYTSGFISGWGDDPVIKIGCKKLERNDELIIDIQNGAKCVSAVFDNLGFAPELHDGVNKVRFDAAVENSMTFTWINGAADFYSMTLNGEKVTTKKNTFSTYCQLNNLKNGDTIVIRVFENDSDVPSDVTLTVDFAEGLADCISSIRNWSNSSFVNLVDGKLTIAKGTDIGINFKDGYTFTRFLLGSEDITSKFTTSSNRLRFVVNETTTLKVEGAPTVYENLQFSAYLMNPEGVALSIGKYGAPAAELGEGQPVTADVALNGCTLEASKSKLYTFDVPENAPSVFISPKEGWFIYTVQAAEGSEFVPISAAGEGSKTFYVIAEPLTNNAKMKVEVNGDKKLFITGDASKSSSWDNPEVRFSISEGSNTVPFCAGYSTPFTIRCSDAIENYQVFVDGKLATYNEEYISYSFTPYTGADKESVVTVYANGTTTGKLVTATLTTEGINATAYYGGALTYPIEEGKDVKYLRSTPTTVKPASSKCTITVNGTVVHGMDGEGTMINGLNADGEYVFTPASSTADIVVSASNSVMIEAISPADGSVVKSLDSVKLTIPMIADSDNMMNTSADALNLITIKKADGTEVAETFELGEPGMNDTYTSFVFPIIFSTPIGEAGEYVITIPEGTFYETAWNDAEGGFVKVENGMVTAPLTATITVDPTMKAPIENIEILPASGSALNKLSVVYINFPDFGAMDMSLQLAEGAVATFTNGTETKTAEINQNWDAGSVRSFMAVLMNRDYEDDPITSAGEWTMSIPAGAFICGGETSPAVEASYKIDPSMPAYPITPVPGSVVSRLNKFTITFVGAESVEYVKNSEITLSGVDYSDMTYYVNATDKANVYEILFSSQPAVAGEYTLTIPAGTFKVNGVMDSEAVTAVYTFAPVWKLTPASGSVIESFDELVIEFPKATTVEFIGDNNSFALSGRNYGAPGLVCTPVADAEHPTFKLTLPEGAQQPPMGSLTFMANEDTFVVDGEPCGEIFAYYSVEHEISTDYQVEPASRNIVYSETMGAYWTFIFDEAAQLTPANYSEFASEVSVKLDGESLKYDEEYFASFENNMLLMGILKPEILKPGTLTVSIGDGALLLSGKSVGSINETFTLVEPKVYTFVTDPKDKAVVSSLNEITVSFPDAATGKLFNEYGISLTKGYEYRASDISVSAVDGAECATFRIEIADAPVATSTPTAYTFTCYPGTFVLDEYQQSPEINITIILDSQSGICNVEVSADGTYNVVNLDGCVILQNADAEKVRTLPAGFYIVNGKKVVVK